MKSTLGEKTKMIKRITIIWILGLFTIVPYGTYYLLFKASKDEYAFLITAILFWIFGFWGVVGPIISAIKVRRIFKRLEQVKSREELKEIINKKESQEAVIDFIASENKIPKFLAKRVYTAIADKLSDKTT